MRDVPVHGGADPLSKAPMATNALFADLPALMAQALAYAAANRATPSQAAKFVVSNNPDVAARAPGAAPSRCADVLLAFMAGQGVVGKSGERIYWDPAGIRP
jgi:hypothetical protein